MNKQAQAYPLKTTFTRVLLQWNENSNQRSMPWKGESDPYKIWLSEIVLQQTRVEQGMAYYLRLVAQYPTVDMLAAAPQEEVFKVWEGLGYYSRCRNLQAAAKQIMTYHNGKFPTDYQQIISLKGVGPYTAAAIASFAFGAHYAVVDGNVIRVLARFFGIETPFDTSAGKKQFADLAQQLLPQAQAAAYNQAIMDFGAMVCKPATPTCEQCPLSAHCTARRLHLVSLLPVKSKKLQKKNRWFAYVLIQSEKGWLVAKRMSKDIWQHLHQFWLLENKEALQWDEEQWMAALQQQGWQVSIHYKSAIFRQQLTHQTIEARFVVARCTAFAAPEGFFWASAAELHQLAFPQLIRQFMAHYPEMPGALL